MQNLKSVFIKKSLLTRTLCNGIVNNDFSFLGMGETELHNCLVDNNIKLEDHDQIKYCWDFLKNLGYSSTDIKSVPGVLKHKIWTIDHRIVACKECGFEEVSVANIARSRFMFRRTIKELKKVGCIPRKVNVVKSMLKHVNPLPPDIYVDDILQCEDLTIASIHRTILTRFLIYRLEATQTQIEMLYRVHYQMNCKPFQYICSNIDFSLDLGYAKEKIIKNAYILAAHPWNIRDVLTNIPNFIGTDIRREMFVYPKLIGLPLCQYREIYDLLKKYGIADVAIAKSMNIFTLSTATIEFRLRKIHRLPEFKILVTNPNIIRLIVHHNRAKSRLSFLQEVKMKCANLTVLGGDVVVYDNHVKDGKDINYRSDIFGFVKSMLRSDTECIEIERKLRQHPFYNYVPLLSIQDSYRCLKRLKYSDAHIESVLPIILYPKNKILTGHKKAHEYFRDNKSSININKTVLLNLTLYFIEKDNHFTGNGIWVNDEENTLM